ncbi:MAG: M16 family metallopeptidase [Paracoccaceae bacterium]
MMMRILFFVLALAVPAKAEMAIQTVTSPGGITAWLVESQDIPFVALEVRFRGGTSLDAPGKRGSVNLMTALIEEGAGDLDAQGFAAARDGLAATFRFSSNSDDVGVSARFLTENRDQALALLRSALVTPRFDQTAVDRVREQVLAGLRADEKDPEAIASRVMSARNFGDHPYGTVGDGTIDSVTALSRDDIVAAHAGSLARDRVYVAAAGDITAAELGALLDDLLGGLPAVGAALPGRAEVRDAGGVLVQDFPGPQSVVSFGHEGIAFDDPDYFAAVLLNEILGGGRFGARLMTEVREKRGLTYGIGTGLATLDQAELLVGQFDSANDKVAEAIEVVRAEWARIGAEGVTEEELAAAKTYMTGSYALRFDGNQAIASILVGMQMIGLTPDYPVTRNARVEAVTMDDVRRVAARLFRPDDLMFVVVGQPVGVVATE